MSEDTGDSREQALAAGTDSLARHRPDYYDHTSRHREWSRQDAWAVLDATHREGHIHYADECPAVADRKRCREQHERVTSQLDAKFRQVSELREENERLRAAIRNHEMAEWEHRPTQSYEAFIAERDMELWTNVPTSNVEMDDQYDGALDGADGEEDPEFRDDETTGLQRTTMTATEPPTPWFDMVPADWLAKTMARMERLEAVLTAVRPHLLYDTPDTYEALRQAVRAADES